MSSTLRGFLPSPVTFSISSPDILLSTLFSEALSLCSSLIVTEHIHTFGQHIGRQNDSGPRGTMHSPEFNLSFISSFIQFRSVSVVPQYLNFTTFSGELLVTFMFWFCPELRSRDIDMYAST